MENPLKVPAEAHLPQKTVYIAHPFQGDPENLARARRWLLWIYRNYPHISPVANWILTIEILDDKNLSDRRHGMRCNRSILMACDEFWMVGGRISNGMREEWLMAIEHGVVVHDLTSLGAEPPSDSEPLVELIKQAFGKAAG